MYGCESLDHNEGWMSKNWCFQSVVLEKTVETVWSPWVPWTARSNQSILESALTAHWKGWCWSWSSNTLATWWQEPTHWKRSWCWERLKARGEAGDRGWDGWMASLTQQTWVWANSGRQWRTRKPGMLHPWVTVSTVFMCWILTLFSKDSRVLILISSLTQEEFLNFPVILKKCLYIFHL